MQRHCGLTKLKAGNDKSEWKPLAFKENLLCHLAIKSTDLVSFVLESPPVPTVESILAEYQKYHALDDSEEQREELRLDEIRRILRGLRVGDKTEVGGSAIADRTRSKTAAKEESEDAKGDAEGAEEADAGKPPYALGDNASEADRARLEAQLAIEHAAAQRQAARERLSRERRWAIDRLQGAIDEYTKQNRTVFSWLSKSTEGPAHELVRASGNADGRAMDGFKSYKALHDNYDGQEAGDTVDLINELMSRALGESEDPDVCISDMEHLRTRIESMGTAISCEIMVATLL